MLTGKALPMFWSILVLSCSRSSSRRRVDCVTLKMLVQAPSKRRYLPIDTVLYSRILESSNCMY
jgi:hypothetical protein